MMLIGIILELIYHIFKGPISNSIAFSQLTRNAQTQ
jgi:hypothetical protein